MLLRSKSKIFLQRQKEESFFGTFTLVRLCFLPSPKSILPGLREYIRTSICPENSPDTLHAQSSQKVYFLFYLAGSYYSR